MKTMKSGEKLSREKNGKMKQGMNIGHSITTICATHPQEVPSAYTPLSTRLLNAALELATPSFE